MRNRLLSKAYRLNHEGVLGRHLVAFNRPSSRYGRRDSTGNLHLHDQPYALVLALAFEDYEMLLTVPEPKQAFRFAACHTA